MRAEAARGAFKPVLVASVFFGFGLLLATGTAAQKVASEASPDRQMSAQTVDKATQAAALERLAGHLATRRSELDARRQAIASEFDRLSATDRPAGEAELALWRNRAGAAAGLERDMATMRALLGRLTPETLQAFSMPEATTGTPFVPDPGLSRTAIDVNLRAAPGRPPFAVVKADTLVARLATDAAGGWRLVAAPSGIGFVPASQLRREP